MRGCGDLAGAQTPVLFAGSCAVPRLVAHGKVVVDSLVSGICVSAQEAWQGLAVRELVIAFCVRARVKV